MHKKNVDRANKSIYAKEETFTQHDVDNLIEQFHDLDLLQNISEEEKKEKRESLRALFEANSLWKDNYIDGIIKKIDDLDEYISEMQQQRALLYKEAEAKKNQIEEIASEFYGLPKTYPEDFKETFPEVLHERANPIKQSMDEMDEIIEKIYSLDKDILNAEQKEKLLYKEVDSTFEQRNVIDPSKPFSDFHEALSSDIPNQPSQDDGRLSLINSLSLDSPIEEQEHLSLGYPITKQEHLSLDSPIQKDSPLGLAEQEHTKDSRPTPPPPPHITDRIAPHITDRIEKKQIPKPAPKRSTRSRSPTRRSSIERSTRGRSPIRSNRDSRDRSRSRDRSSEKSKEEPIKKIIGNLLNHTIESLFQPISSSLRRDIIN